jgi:hypothetical protein
VLVLTYALFPAVADAGWAHVSAHDARHSPTSPGAATRT